MLALAALLAGACASAEETVRWTDEGPKRIAFNDKGEYLMLSQSLELDDEGMVSHVGVIFTLMSPYEGVMWTDLHHGDGSDKLEQAVANGDGWVATGSSSSSDTFTGWHEGWYDGKEAKTDGWVVALDANGAIAWMRSYGGSDWDSFSGICHAQDGGWIVVGNTYSSDGDVYGWHDSGIFIQPDGWVVHVGEDSEIRWSLALGGSGYDEIYAVQPIPEGYLVAGVTDSMDGDVYGLKGDRDGWLAVINPQGELVRQQCLGGTDEDMFTALGKGPGTYLAAGTSWSAMEGDHDPQENGWAVCLDERGTPLWSIRFGGRGIERVSYAHWNDDFWIVSGTTQVDGEEHTWLVGISQAGNEWQLLRGEL